MPASKTEETWQATHNDKTAHNLTLTIKSSTSYQTFKKCLKISDVFEDNMVKAKAKDRGV